MPTLVEQCFGRLLAGANGDELFCPLVRLPEVRAQSTLAIVHELHAILHGLGRQEAGCILRSTPVKPLESAAAFTCEPELARITR